MGRGDVTGTYVTPVSRQQIERELRLGLNKEALPGGKIYRDSREFANDVRDTWVRIWEMMGPHPYETRDYVESIKVHGVGKATKLGRDARGRFTGHNVYAHYRVSTDNEHAGFIEYGTGPDNPDSRSPWGPNTPTPEFAPAAATAAFYGGTPD